MNSFDEGNHWNKINESPVLKMNHGWGQNSVPNATNNIFTDVWDSTENLNQMKQPTTSPSGKLLNAVVVEGNKPEEPEFHTPSGNVASTANISPRSDVHTDVVKSNTIINSNNDMELFTDITKQLWYTDLRKSYNPLEENIIHIEDIPELVGLFFKHINYKVRHSIDLNSEGPISSDKTVIRRYSDFVWLRRVLIKKYPFRMVPELPPKKLGAQNTNRKFIEKRRKGLSRFINLIMKHPILQGDELVITFLTVPVELSSWRTQATYDLSDEFTDEKISKEFKNAWKSEYTNKWNIADSNIDLILEVWYKIGMLVERYERRLRETVQEKNMLGTLLDHMSKISIKLYPEDENIGSIDVINNKLQTIRDSLKSTNTFDADESEVYSSIIIPKFKIFVDVINSLKGVFNRYRIIGRNDIVRLKRKVELSMEKLKTIEDQGSNEYLAIQSIIEKDKKTIVDQTNRAWLIRKCLLHEFSMFQETQHLLTDAFLEWIKTKSTFSGLKYEEWKRLLDQLQQT
ncbi:hypothetical protein TBLA_0B00520 [Henningerozyma blattae CBS 6284]|uniref:Sorting nexin MVP1 n=1 Tax=Henningerozyma blattae (strain ATCC 34711 / CBS 6284 / DSM 70876 / NBRC 10599 / NRRL Y-10934 / UCD 77-7) TaxID=1071380 RepID=I2GXP4_HENB6|nr:hypothetical protein TBLA_0B00520 [Tetrapisispora blattae CBS 6284]CCH58896.1 hypothetical protein TBLA_0B00520 [Tetrapisispora blattae CBS 6284]